MGTPFGKLHFLSYVQLEDVRCSVGCHSADVQGLALDCFFGRQAKETSTGSDDSPFALAPVPDQVYWPDR